MKISIFKSTKAHPKNKSEKSWESSHLPLPEAVVVKTEEDLINAVSNFAWSPFVFEGKRHADNFVSCDFLVYDIDEGLRIEEAEKLIQRYNSCCLCLPSPSHTPENHRFRLILPLSRTIFNKEVYKATWEYWASVIGSIDTQCQDEARFYFGSTLEDGFFQEGNLIDPIMPEVEEKEVVYKTNHIQVPVTEDLNKLVEFIYGQKRDKIPEVVEFFLSNAHSGLPGLWVNTLNSFCFTLALTGIEEDVIMAVVEQIAPEQLDHRDLYQIKRSVRDAKKKRNDEL